MSVNDTAWLDPTTWHVLLLTYLGATTNGGSKLYACPADVKGGEQVYPTVPYQFEMNKRANGYMFRSKNGETVLSPLRTKSVRAPSSMLMITEKEWNSPDFQTASDKPRPAVIE